MLAEAVNCTHNGTGGSGTLTLASVSGYPQITSVFGTSGTLFVHYKIAEYTDSTLVTLSKYESGTGSIALSTNVLTRTVPKVTWDGTTYDNTAPSALTFGNTAANVRITLTVGHESAFSLAPRAHDGSTGVTTEAWMPFDYRAQFNSSVGTYTLVNNRRLWMPVHYKNPRQITDVAVRVTTGESAKNLRMGIYDWDPSNGLPGNLISEFTSSTQISLTTGSAYGSVTIPSALFIPPGMYWICMIANSTTAVIQTLQVHTNTGFASSGQRDCVYLYKDVTYGALPSTGDQSALAVITLSSGGAPHGFWKP